jgi:hypothetical protein
MCGRYEYYSNGDNISAGDSEKFRLIASKACATCSGLVGKAQ